MHTATLPRRRDFGKILPERFDDSSAPDPQSDGDADAAVEQDPDWRGRLRLHDPRGPDQP